MSKTEYIQWNNTVQENKPFLYLFGFILYADNWKTKCYTNTHHVMKYMNLNKHLLFQVAAPSEKTQSHSSLLRCCTE